MPNENAEHLYQFAREFKMSPQNIMEQNVEGREMSVVTSNVTVNSKICEVVSSLVALKLPEGSGKMKSLIKALVCFLPGPFTPQKFCGLDIPSADLAKFYEFHYRQVLQITLERFSPEWVDAEAEVLISKLMVSDGSGVTLLYDTLHVLTTALRETKGPSQKLDYIINVLEKIMRSGALVSAVLDHSSDRNKSSRSKLNVLMIQNHLDQIWEEIVQLVVSLPSRVSNKLKYTIEDTFVPDFYCKVLCCHIARCVQFLSEAVCNEDIPLKLQGLSVLLSKVIINFNDGRKSVGILTLIEIFEHWCSSHVYQTVVQNILLNLHLQAIETVLRMILGKCSSPSAVRNILGDTVHQSQTWKHVLCTKMLLMSYHDWRDSTLVENLVGYLAYMHFENVRRKAGADGVPVITDGGILIDVLVNLLVVWGDGSALNHTPLEQHIYITQAVILCVHYLHITPQAEECDKRRALTESERKLIESRLFLGIPVHLESPLEPVRAVGMITAEIVTSVLHASDEPKLKFEYEGLSKEAESIVRALKELVPREIKVEVKDQQDVVRNRTDCNTQMHDDDTVVGNELLQCLESQCGLALVSEDAGDQNVNVREWGEECVKMKRAEVVDVVTEEEHMMQRDSDDSLDSDDDFIPYDMSGDIKQSTKKRPKYLRDLRDGLLETEDCERFSESLEVCETLILAQLPDDDVSLGIELLEILICLEEKFCVDNFDTQRYSASVAIVLTFPEPCAEYICSQFNMGFGKYSIGQRLFMLDCLAGAAKKLSNIQAPIKTSEGMKGTKHPQLETGRKLGSTQDAKENVPHKLVNAATDIIRRRIESHTRRFISASKPAPVGQANKFSAVAGSFFFPLLYGVGSSSGGNIFLSSSNADRDCLLLVHFLHTIAVVMTSSVNCTASVRMGKELMDLCWTLRYHSQSKVRLAIMGCVGAVIFAVPKPRLISDFYESLLECRLWLLDVMKSGLRQGDPDSECREFAAYLLVLIGSVIGENVLPSGFVNPF
ncbi:Telomere length regulation protein TEL2-like protein [Cryptotermes secundus]|uniref:Telomere length regulation protein TEL2-like protein n=3 Tax=Cryptotermes secundus TaxID=105785 RepID=A0A2J7QHV4_9NEOP|nr:Telomere length regulation protein TEL2-like protein [Cryptotermes secundus]